MLKTKTRPRKVEWYLLCMTITLFFSKVYGDDPVFSPSTLNDTAGNFADQDSVVTWADLPESSPYNAGNPSRVSEGLTPYYNFMHSFVGGVFPADIPDSLIENIANGTMDKIISNYSSYINVFLGYAVCVAVGLLFILIFPIVGCCVCCCRCCGKCGGKMIQTDEEAENSCARNAFFILLAVMIAFITVGMVCAFLNNNNTTTAIDGIADTARSNLNDIKTFVNNTVDEANHIARNNYEFLKATLLRDIDNIAYLVGIPLRTTIKSNTNIESVITDAYALNDDLTQASADLDDVNTKLTSLNNSLVELETALNTVTTNLDTAFGLCLPCAGAPDYNTGASMGVDSSQFPDLSTQTADMSSATGQNLTEKVAEAEKELDDIPWRVHNDSEQTRTDVKTSVENLSDDLEPMLNSVDAMHASIYGENATVNLTSYEEKIDEYAELASKYNKYRWYGGIGLTCIILLIILLAALGLIFGMVSCDTSVNPPERGCLSNCGGNLLIASVVFIFIFAALLMLLTTVTFLLGAPMERYVCQTITDPSLTQMEKYFDGTYNKITVGDGKYFLGNTFFQNSTIPLTLTGMLRDCKDNKGAFEAFQLSSQFDIADLLNYSKTLDVDAEINKTNVDLSNVTVYPTSLQTQLSDLKNAININFTQFYNELNKSPTNSSLTFLADDLDAYAAVLGNPFEAAVNIETAELRRIDTEEVVYVNGNITALNASVNAMETTVSGLPTKIDNIETGLSDADTYIQNNASSGIKDLLKTYATRLTGIADSFVAYTDNSVRTGLGKCVPVWNVYESFLVYTFCYNLMDTFNGFWFSLGWCVFFFIPSLIFSFKYARFLRRMDYVPEDEIPPKPDRFSFFVALFTSFEIQKDGKITFAGDASEQADIQKGSFQRMLSLPTPEILDDNHKPMFKLSSSGNTSNGDKCNSTGVTSIAQRPDDSQKDTLASKTEYTRIYPDLSNRYAEPHDFLIGDNFAMSDNIALVAGPDNESPKRNGRVVSGGKKLIENESNKNEHITPEKQVDESHLTTHQLTFEQQNGFVTNTGIDDPNYRENPEILLENHTQIKNESAISEDPPNETDNGNIEVDELFYTRQDDSYSIDKFEQSTDEGGQSSNSSRNSFDTVVNIGKQENAIKPETRFIEPIIDKYPEECSNQNDKKTYNMDVSESFDRNNSSPSQQTINSHQIIVSPVQDTERINVEQVHQDTIDSELAELAKV